MNFSHLAEHLSIVTGGKHKVLTQTQLQNLGPVKSIIQTKAEVEAEARREDDARELAAQEARNAAADGGDGHGRLFGRGGGAIFLPSMASKADVMRHIESSGSRVLLNCFVSAAQVVSQRFWEPAQLDEDVRFGGRRRASLRRQFVTSLRSTVAGDAAQSLTIADDPSDRFMVSKLVNANAPAGDVIAELFEHLLRASAASGMTSLVAPRSPYYLAARTLRACRGTTVSPIEEAVDDVVAAHALLLADLELALALADGTPVIALNKIVKKKRPSAAVAGDPQRRDAPQPSPSPTLIAQRIIASFAVSSDLNVSSKPLLHILANVKPPKRPLVAVTSAVLESLLDCKPPFNVALYLPPHARRLRSLMADEAVAREALETQHFATFVAHFAPYWDLLQRDTASRVAWYVEQSRQRHTIHRAALAAKRAAEGLSLCNEETAVRSRILAEEMAAVWGSVQLESERAQLAVALLMRRRVEVLDVEAKWRAALAVAERRECANICGGERLATRYHDIVTWTEEQQLAAYKAKAWCLHEAAKALFQLA